MQARAGSYPTWNEYKAVRGNTGTKSSYISGDMQWDLASGWHFKRSRGWQNKGKGRTHKVSYYDAHGNKMYSDVDNVRMRTVIGTDGRPVQVRVNETDFNDQIGFHANENHDDQYYKERVAYAEKALGTENQPIVVDGCGHIAKLEYAEREQVLRVTFTNNSSVCIFFRVPRAVAGSLIAVAASKATSGRYYSDGRPKHSLGILFWDYIRIRGFQHGAKYPWEYEYHGEGKIVNSRNRHVMRLDAKTALAIMGDDNPVSKRLLASGANLKPNDLVTVVLNDEEYIKLGEEVNSQMEEQARIKAQNNQMKEVGQGEDSKGNIRTEIYDAANDFTEDVLDRVEREQMYAAVTKWNKKHPGETLPDELQEFIESDKKRQAMLKQKEQLKQTTKPSALYDFTRQAETELLKQIEQFKKDHEAYILAETGRIANGWSNRSKKNRKDIDPEDRFDFAQDKALAHIIHEFGAKGLSDVIRLRGSDWQKGLPEHTHISGKYDYETMKAIVKAAFGTGAIQTWMKSNLPAKYAMHFVGRFWTPQQLIEFANPTVPNNINVADAAAYKRFINARDWQGALNFLKNHKTDLIYSDPSTGKQRTLRRQPYASQYDKLASDDNIEE